MIEFLRDLKAAVFPLFAFIICIIVSLLAGGAILIIAGVTAECFGHLVTGIILLISGVVILIQVLYGISK